MLRVSRPAGLAQLAKAAGIAPAYLAQIEQGVRKGSLSTVRKLAAALKVDVELVLPRED
jgi:transcriptional regulator with XRE-family HTH domain